jgi:hypothetical protein
MSRANENEIAAHGGETSHVEPDDIGIGMMTVLFGLCGVSLVLMVVLLQAWFYNWKDAVVAERPPVESAPAAIAAEQLKRIENYGWADPKRQVRTIPISRAMDLIVQEYGEAEGGVKKASN